MLLFELLDELSTSSFKPNDAPLDRLERERGWQRGRQRVLQSAQLEVLALRRRRKARSRERSQVRPFEFCGSMEGTRRSPPLKVRSENALEGWIEFCLCKMQ